MADSCPRPRLVKIVLSISGVFFTISIVCFLVGGPLYFQERAKMRKYEQDTCRFISTSYETIKRCSTTEGRSPRYEMCMKPRWQVEFGQNRTRKGAVEDGAEKFQTSLQARFEKYQVGSSYPCWYNTEKTSELIWYKPTTSYALILLITGAAVLPFAIASLIVFFRLRERADL